MTENIYLSAKRWEVETWSGKDSQKGRKKGCEKVVGETGWRGSITDRESSTHSNTTTNRRDRMLQ